MNYPYIYFQLICKRKENPLSRKDEYCECHHIIPKSEGGSDDQTNLVLLTAREHFIAHLLLAKIYDDYKMWCATHKMQFASDNQNREYKISNRIYKLMREERSKKQSEFQRGENNPRWGKPGTMLNKHLSDNAKKILSEKAKKRTGKLSAMCGKHHTDEAKEKMSAIHKNKPLSEAHKQKLSSIIKGRPNPNCGKPNIGKKWWNNGIVEYFRFECPEGFVRGRLKKKNARA